jgi:hypothetical protein
MIKPKPRLMYAAVNPWGDILTGTVNYYAGCARGALVQLFGLVPDDLRGQDRRDWFKAQWKKHYKDGYRVISVEVRPV